VEILANPQRLIDDLRSGRVIGLSDFDYTPAPNNAVVLADVEY
jgi:hypothetical protein